MLAQAGQAPVPGVATLRETRMLKRTHGRMTTYRHPRTGSWPVNRCIPLTSPTILKSGLRAGCSEAGVLRRPEVAQGMRGCGKVQYLGTSGFLPGLSSVGPPYGGALNGCKSKAGLRHSQCLLAWFSIYVVLRIVFAACGELQWRIFARKSFARSDFGFAKKSSFLSSSTMRPLSMKITRCATFRAKPIS